jgi:hypothetical protein
VEHQQHPQKHERVADAEHVRAGPARGDGEDVAEKRDIRPFYEVRVRELTRADVEPGRLKRPARRRHHPSVRHDRDQIEEPAQRNDPDEPQIEVPHHTRAGQRIGEQVRSPVQSRVALGRDSHDHNLDRERQRRQPDPAQPDLLESPQPSARHRDGQEQQAEG